MFLKNVLLNWLLPHALYIPCRIQGSAIDGSRADPIRSTKAFLYNIREPRYKQIKMVYQISKILDIELSSV